MTRSLQGIILATLGVLVLTPDTMFMRWSGLDGLAMTAWRGLCIGSVFCLIWAATAENRAAQLLTWATGVGLFASIAHGANALLFAVGIAAAPVSVVLFGVATSPIWAALFSRLLMGEPTSPATWITILLVFAGIGIAVFGDGGPSMTLVSLFGALAGLGVAATLAMTFVLFRKYDHIPILLCVGIGSLMSGFFGLGVGGVGAMQGPGVWAILVSGIVILPFSFWALGQASRYTHASNVSLLLLLETILGPLWVWWGVGEAPTVAMLIGGVIVVVTLATYIWISSRRT